MCEGDRSFLRSRDELDAESYPPSPDRVNDEWAWGWLAEISEGVNRVIKCVII